MRKRENHYLESVPAFVRPERYLSLGVAMSPVITTGENSGKNEMECVAWHLSETFMGRHDPVYGKVRTGETGEQFSVAIAAMLKQGQVVDLWCMNSVALLGTLGFWEGIEAGRWKVKDENWQGQVILSDPPTIIVARITGVAGVVRILDLKNLGLKSLDELRIAVSAEDCCGSDWQSKIEHADIAASVQCAAVADYVEQWYDTLEKEKLGEAKPTLPGQAWSAFRHRFNNSAILVHANNQALALEAEALYPGRVEAFKLGKISGPIYHLDFASYYPSLCLKGLFPSRLRKVMDRGFHLSELVKDFCCIADVTIHTDHNFYPKRRKEDKSIIWPVGRFRTTLAGRELVCAINWNHVVKVNRVAIYDQEPIFRDFASWAIGKRFRCKLHDDLVGEKVVKLFTNALWGMFAKRQRTWRNNSEVMPSGPWGDWYESAAEGEPLDHCRSVGWLGQTLRDDGFAHDACPQITAAVNAAGRMALLRAMSYVIEGKIYYVATDSLFCNEIAYSELCLAGLVAENEPGKLKLKSVEKWLDIRGINDYDTESESKVSGRPANAVGDSCAGWSWDSFENPSGALKRGERPGPYLVPRRRSASEVYRHGIVDISGNVTPIRLNERD